MKLSATLCPHGNSIDADDGFAYCVECDRRQQAQINQLAARMERKYRPKPMLRQIREKLALAVSSYCGVELTAAETRLAFGAIGKKQP